METEKHRCDNLNECLCLPFSIFSVLVVGETETSSSSSSALCLRTLRHMLLLRRQINQALNLRKFQSLVYLFLYTNIVIPCGVPEGIPWEVNASSWASDGRLPLPSTVFFVKNTLVYQKFLAPFQTTSFFVVMITDASLLMVLGSVVATHFPLNFALQC